MGGKTTKRDLIRAAAYECFRDQGYDRASVDDICKAASVSKGSFYWHYTSKQEVFTDILEVWTLEVMEQLHDQFERAVKEDDYVSAITKALEREVHRGRAIVPIWVDAMVHARHEEGIRLALSHFYDRIRRALVEIFRPILGRHLSEEELAAVAATSFGAYTGLMLQELCDPSEAEASSALPQFMSAIRIWNQYTRAVRSDGSEGEPS